MRNALKYLYMPLMFIAATTGTAQPGHATGLSKLSHEVPAYRKGKRPRYNGTRLARKYVKEGEMARLAGNHAEALRDYKKAVSLDPYYAEGQLLHFLFMRDRQKMLVNLKSQMKIHSENPVYPWVLAMSIHFGSLSLQEKYCQQAVRIDQSFPQGWACLAHLEMLRYNRSKAKKYFRRAMSISPYNETLANQYANFLISDHRLQFNAIKALLKRFPESNSIARALVQSTDNLKSLGEQVAVLEGLLQGPSSQNQIVASNAALKLYPIYLSNNLNKAKLLCQEMDESAKGSEQWTTRKKFVSSLIQAQNYITAGKTNSALQTLRAAKNMAVDVVGKNKWSLLNAKALYTDGKAIKAVTILRKRFISQPSEVVYKAMVGYGARIGESEAAINESVWTRLRERAKSAHPFTLKMLGSDKSVSLDNYRGSVVILDFWFPDCVACRADFPFLNDVAVEFEKKGLTVLAINGIKEQQPFALPYLRGEGYHFVGLAADAKFATHAYNVYAYPATFFIGPEGKVLFKFDIHNNATKKSAESAVRFMLSKAKKT